MATKTEKKRKMEKTGCRCELCGKIGESSGSQMIHVKCAIDYVKTLGYNVSRFVSPLEWGYDDE